MRITDFLILLGNWRQAVILALPSPQRPLWYVIYAANNGQIATIGAMTATMTRQALAKRIAEVAVLRGEFRLRSGRTSDYYIDKYLFTTQPDILAELGKMLAERVPGGTTRLAGAELGGIPLVSAASMASGLPCVFVRNAKKDYGTAKE